MKINKKAQRVWKVPSTNTWWCWKWCSVTATQAENVNFFIISVLVIVSKLSLESRRLKAWTSANIKIGNISFQIIKIKLISDHQTNAISFNQNNIFIYQNEYSKFFWQFVFGSSLSWLLIVEIINMKHMPLGFCPFFCFLFWIGCRYYTLFAGEGNVTSFFYFQTSRVIWIKICLLATLFIYLFIKLACVDVPFFIFSVYLFFFMNDSIRVFIYLFFMCLLQALAWELFFKQHLPIFIQVNVFL